MAFDELKNPVGFGNIFGSGGATIGQPPSAADAPAPAENFFPVFGDSVFGWPLAEFPCIGFTLIMGLGF